MVHFIPTMEKTLAEGLVRLFRDNMWKLHRLPESIISDRGPQFTARLIRELNKMLGIKSKLSMAFHPQTDGQTESKPRIKTIPQDVYRPQTEAMA